MAIQKAAPKAAAPAAKPAATPATKSAAPAIGHNGGPVIKEQTLTVSTTVLNGGTIQGVPVEESTVDVRIFATTPAMAVAGVKLKKNLGDYNALEIFVSQTIPCYVEDLDSVQAQVNENVIRILDERFAAFDGSAYGLAEGGAAEDLTGGEGEVADAGTEGEEVAGEEEGVTPDYINTASREDLEALIAGNPEGTFTFTAEDYPDDDDLRSMMIADLFPDGVEGAADEATEGDTAPYTQEDLESYDMDGLAEIFAGWDMGPFPKFNAKNEAIVKKNAIKKILELQDNPPPAE